MHSFTGVQGVLPSIGSTKSLSLIHNRQEDYDDVKFCFILCTLEVRMLGNGYSEYFRVNVNAVCQVWFCK